MPRESDCTRPMRRRRRSRLTTPRFLPTTCALSARANCPRPGAASGPPLLAHDFVRKAFDAIESRREFLARGCVGEPHVIRRVEIVAANDSDLRLVEDDRRQAVAVADRLSL